MNVKDKFFKQKNERKRDVEKFVRKEKTSEVKPERPSQKHFDKKAYRIKKYSNKYKLDKWEQNRRKHALKKFHDDVRKDPMIGTYKPFNFDEGTSKDGAKPAPPNYVMHPDLMDKFINEKNSQKQETDSGNKKMNSFTKAKMELQRIKEEKVSARNAKIAAGEERKQALEQYKQKKAERFRKLSKKTKTGQPLMKDRMQMLLEAIQRN